MNSDMVKPEKFGHLTFKRQPHKMEEGAQACQSENFFLKIRKYVSQTQLAFLNRSYIPRTQCIFKVRR